MTEKIYMNDLPLGKQYVSVINLLYQKYKDKINGLDGYEHEKTEINVAEKVTVIFEKPGTNIHLTLSIVIPEILNRIDIYWNIEGNIKGNEPDFIKDLKFFYYSVNMFDYKRIQIKFDFYKKFNSTVYKLLFESIKAIDLFMVEHPNEL